MVPLYGVHERFLAAPDDPLPDVVRPVVAQSWRRSLLHGVDPQGSPPLALDGDHLSAYRQAHPLAPLMPLVRTLLIDDADEAGHIVAVGDAEGRLLWVEGHKGLRRRAERMGFVPGALWSEQGAGTNAPGTALALAKPVQIHAAEHFGVGVHPWSCVAAPVRDPFSGLLLGVIDLTGGDDVCGPRSLALARACAAAMEAQLLATGRTRRPSAARALKAVPARSAPSKAVPSKAVPAKAVLTLLGAGGVAPTLELQDADGRRRSVALSPRHAEIVWILALAGQRGTGMTSQALDAALHERGSHPVTVRAEMARLRKALGSLDGQDVLASRPYRFTVTLESDVDALRRHLARGAVLKALDAFPAVPLAASTAPGVVAAREELVAELREAVLRSRSATALERWTALDSGHDDAAAWELFEQVLPYGSPRRATARAHRRRVATL